MSIGTFLWILRGAPLPVNENSRFRPSFITFFSKPKPFKFWIQTPLGTVEGNYLGTLEMTMDIAPYKEIDGEKRLLDWRD